MAHATEPTPPGDLALSVEWCGGEPGRRHRFELDETRVRFLAHAANGGWELLAETTRADVESPFAIAHLSIEQREKLAYYLEWAPKDGVSEHWIDDMYLETFGEMMAEGREQTGDEPDIEWWGNYTDELADALRREPTKDEIAVARYAYARRAETLWHEARDREWEEMWQRNPDGLN